jgi:hypothetical protein
VRESSSIVQGDLRGCLLQCRRVASFPSFWPNALFTNSHHFSEANSKCESYLTIHEAVEPWQALQRCRCETAPGLGTSRAGEVLQYCTATKVPTSNNAITFCEVSPLDYAGLADAQYTYADRVPVLELDNNRDAATYAEESVQCFREAKGESPDKYALDFIFSLSLASSCLACTELGVDALEQAKQAVKVLHRGKGDRDPQYNNHFRRLLTTYSYPLRWVGGWTPCRGCKVIVTKWLSRYSEHGTTGASRWQLEAPNRESG